MVILLSMNSCFFLLSSSSPQMTILFSITSQEEQTVGVLSTVPLALPPTPATLVTHKQLFPCNYAQAAIQMDYYLFFFQMIFQPMFTLLPLPPSLSPNNRVLIRVSLAQYRSPDHINHRGNYLRNVKQESFYL